jgi:hypothetical protein
MGSGKIGIATKKHEACSLLSEINLDIKSFLEKEQRTIDFKEQFCRSYYSIIPISIIAQDSNWIAAFYWDEGSKDKEIYFEVFKNLKPSKNGLEDYKGYFVFRLGEQYTASYICRYLDLDWGGDSAPRVLWRHLINLAEKTGVELPGCTYQEFSEFGFSQAST